MNTSPDLTITAVKMILALVAILIVLIFVYRLLKRLPLSPIKNDNSGYIRIIENKYLGLKKNLYLVEIPGSILVLGVSNENISYLTEIQNDKIIERNKAENNRTNLTFSGYIQQFALRKFPDRFAKNRERV
jgi:flagellar protein FliO/FliZ